MLCAPLSLALAIAAQNPPLEFVIDHIGDERLSGVLQKLDVDGSVHLSGGQSISGTNVVALQRSGTLPRRPDDRAHILLANGDCLPGRLVSIENEKIRFAAHLGATVEINLPLTAAFALYISPRAPADAKGEIGSKRRHDTLRLSNGDSITGTILTLARDGPLRIESGGQTSEVARDRIGALFFNSELARSPKPRGSYRRIVLQNGARLSLASATADSTTLSGKTVFGGETISIPMAQLNAMYVLSGPAEYLSDLKPQRYEHTPYLGVHWPLGVDRSVAGNELRLGGGTFDKGLGLHSACVVTYKLPPNARRFEALVGLDEETGRRGAVLIDIRGDGRSLLPKPLEMLGRDPPRELRVPLPAGCKELSIRVDFGAGGDIQDHVNLADARFIVEPR